MKKNVSIILTLVFLSTTISCASNGFLMAKPVVTLFGEAYPAKGVNEKIDVYMTTKPVKEYLEVAKISCGDTSDKWSLDQITLKAREIGADAIIIIGNSGSTGVAMPIGNSAYGVSSNYGMEAIAIKYK